MADVTYKDALIQEVETSRLEKLRGSLARTIFGYALLALCGLQYVTAGPVRDGGPSFFIFLSGCAAFATLLGYTPRMFRQLSVIANAPICATPYYQNKEATIQAGLADGSLHSPTLSDLGRKLHALFLVRMLGVVALLMIVVAWGMIG